MMGGVSWIKMSGTMVDPRRETLKLHWLKCPKLLSKYKFEPESKWFSLILHYSFAQKTSIILRTSTHSILSKIYSCNTAKIMFLVGVRKNICTAPFLDAKKLHSRSTWKANLFIPVKIRPEIFISEM